MNAGEDAQGAGTTVPASKVAELSFFFPAHNEEANLEALVAEALATLPSLAQKFEVIAVDDGSGLRPSPTSWRNSIRTSSASSITPPTWATGRRSDPASERRDTI